VKLSYNICLRLRPALFKGRGSVLIDKDKVNALALLLVWDERHKRVHARVYLIMHTMLLMRAD
jgi:hypothetical protein